MGKGEADPLREACKRARHLWEDLLRMMIAKDRLYLAGAETEDVDRMLEMRGVELARVEAEIARLDPPDDDEPELAGVQGTLWHA